MPGFTQPVFCFSLRELLKIKQLGFLCALIDSGPCAAFFARDYRPETGGSRCHDVYKLTIIHQFYSDRQSQANAAWLSADKWNFFFSRKLFR